MPSRSNRFISGLISGYGSIAANVIFTMTSVPLALHYLEKEQFGLWALAVQINGYLGLIDLGMSGAISRYIADYKDDVDGGEYGSHLLTGALVFLVQGVLIALAGMVFSWFAPQAFAIPNHLAHEFQLLILILTSYTGLSVFLRSAGSPLWAFQRNDVVYGCSSVGLFLMLGLLWIGFHLGWGVMSFAIAQIPMLICTIPTYIWVCIRNRYYPSLGKWRAPSFTIFWKIFQFGKDNLLVTMGTQLTSASQIMIISRWISLDAAATFSIATKFYTMAIQLTTNPVAASAPGLTEIYVRGENERFVRRYWDIITLTITVSLLAAICLTVGNRSLIMVWTGGSIGWTWVCDLLLGLMIVLRNFNGCLIGMFGLMKNWRPVRHIYFLEGIAFIPVAILLASYAGITGILIASLLVHLGVTTTLSFREARKVLGEWAHPNRTIFGSMALITISAAIAWAGSKWSVNPFIMLFWTTACLTFTALISWRLLLPKNLRSESLNRLFGVFSFLKKLSSKDA